MLRPLTVLLGLGLVVGCSSTDDAGADGSGARGSSSSGAASNSGGSASGGQAGDGSGATQGSGAAQGSGSAQGSGGAASGGATSTPVLPPENAAFDYQLGGAYAPPDGVAIVTRDRTEEPASGLYNICYVNGFQIQPSEESFWETDHPELILRDANDQPVIDEDWDEMLIDVGTSEKRTAVASVVGEWIRGCKKAGFDAVEIDNLDSFSRSDGLLTEENAVQMMKLFSDVAHEEGLAIAQKNSAELVPRRGDMGTDFVVAEECNTWDECDVYTGAYGNHVLVIEYVEADFEKGCASYPELSIVLRDLDLVTQGSVGYVYDGC